MYCFAEFFSGASDNVYHKYSNYYTFMDTILRSHFILKNCKQIVHYKLSITSDYSHLVWLKE